MQQKKERIKNKMNRLNNSLRIDALEFNDPVDLNGSYKFRNTPTRMSSGGYKCFFNNNVRVPTQNKTKKQLFNQSSIDNDDAISLTLNRSPVTRKSISKKRMDLDYKLPDENLGGKYKNDSSDESYFEPEKIVSKKSNKTIMKLQAEAGVSIRRTPSAKRTPKKASVSRRNTIGPGSTILTPSLQKRLNSKIDQSGMSIYERARNKLHVSNTPECLPCREQQFTDIYTFIETNLRNQTGGCMYVCGVPGTGKTLTTRQVISCLKECVSADELDPFKFIDVNAFQVTEPHQIYKLIYKELTDENASAEHAVMLLEKKFEQKNSESIVLLVDELDMLCTKKQDVLYNLFDWPYKKNSKWIVIAIANAMNLPEQVMMNKISSRLGLTRLNFQPYTHNELEEIVTLRLRELNVFDMDAIVYASRKVAAVSGDARRALEICRRATELAEKDNIVQTKFGEKHSLVTISHVDNAIKAMFSSAKITALQNASLMEQHFMKSIANIYLKSGIEETTLNKIFEEHTLICKFNSLKTLNRTQLLNVCCSLASSKMILLEPSKNIYLQRVRCNMNTDDIEFGIKKNDVIKK